MADDHSFSPAFPAQDDATAQSTDAAAEQLATPQQWAAMKFAPVSIDPDKFDAQWEQARGACARMTITLLSFDDEALTRQFMNRPEPLHQALATHSGLQHEIEYLKMHIEAMEMAATRMLCVASRCAERSA